MRKQKHVIFLRNLLESSHLDRTGDGRIILNCILGKYGMKVSWIGSDMIMSNGRFGTSGFESSNFIARKLYPPHPLNKTFIQ
jgi:hypothetical protein